ncbi:MAG: hypothetical protein VYD71_02080 [Bacteroidota bacterium]|nr:hypothetical protein [Bacteroidota bacterium]
MQKLLLAFLSISLFYSSNAQTEIDALRYSKSDILGTARFSAMAGAYGALGGDFTTLSYNPAGIGFYQFSELSFSPSIYNNTTTSFFAGEKNTDESRHANFTNLGYVVSSPKNDKQWKRINMALGYNRIANYKSRTYINGYNSSSSLIDHFVANANTQGVINNLDGFAELLAWNTYLFDPTDTIDNGIYISNLNSNLSKRQEKIIESSGNSGEYVFAVGTSFEDKIYLGATFGIPNIEYYEKSTYTESEFADTSTHLQSFEYQEEFSTVGNGLNLKLGIIARLNDWVKVGGALHSPTFYDMEDEYSTSIRANWNDTLGIMYNASPFGYFNYELKTPWKAMGSAAINIKKKALITADIEMIDYASAKFNSDSYKFTEENKIINSTYTKATNIKLGGELKYKPFRIRGGYALYGSPFKENIELERKSYTFGFGIDRGYLIVDFAYVLTEGSDEHFMYNPDLIGASTIISTSHNLLFTLGLRY